MSRWGLLTVAVCFFALLSISPAAVANESRSLLTVRELVEAPFIAGLTVSPDGLHAAFLTDVESAACNCHQQRWHLLDLETDEVTTIDASDEVIISWLADGRINGATELPRPVWSPNSRELLYLKKQKGRIVAVVYDVLTHDRRLLESGGEEVYSVAWLSNDSVLYQTGGPAASAERAWLDGLRNGFRFTDGFVPSYQALPVIPKAPGFAGSGAGGSGHLFGSVYAVEPRYRVITLSSGRRDNATAEQVKSAFTSHDVSSVQLGGNASPKRIYGSNGSYATRVGIPDELTPRMAWESRLVVHSKRGEASCGEICTGYITDVFWSSALGKFVFARVDPKAHDLKSFYVVSDDGLSAKRIFEIGRLYTTWEALDDYYCGIGKAQVICIDESAASPPRVVGFSLRDGHRTILYDPNGGIRAKMVNKVEHYSWALDKGDGATGHLIYPANFHRGRKYPLVLVEYMDDGFLRGGTGNEIPVFPIADHGMFVLDIGWPALRRQAYAEYEAAQARKGRPVRYYTRQFEEIDRMVGGVIADLVKRGYVDPTRIAYTGLSAGSDYVSYALATHEPIAAAITAGLSGDPIGWYLRAPAYANLHGGALGGYLARGNPDVVGLEKWRTLSPSLNAKNINVAVLINAPDHEYLLSTEFFKAMRDAHKPVEMYVYPDEYHIKWQPSQRLAMFSRNLDWLNFWLQGEEDPDPHKAEQYRRWSKLCDELVASHTRETHCIPSVQ